MEHIKNILYNNQLSFKAKGILLFIVNNPHIKPTITNLSSISKDNKDAIASGLLELVRYGYLIRSFEKVANGSPYKYQYHLNLEGGGK